MQDWRQDYRMHRHTAQQRSLTYPSFKCPFACHSKCTTTKYQLAQKLNFRVPYKLQPQNHFPSTAFLKFSVFCSFPTHKLQKQWSTCWNCAKNPPSNYLADAYDEDATKRDYICCLNFDEMHSDQQYRFSTFSVLNMLVPSETHLICAQRLLIFLWENKPWRWPEKLQLSAVKDKNWRQGRNLPLRKHTLFLRSLKGVNP